MSEEAVSYQAAVPGSPVFTRNGTEIGTLEHILEIPGSDVFDGIVIATDWGLRFIDASRVDLIVQRVGHEHGVEGRGRSEGPKD